MYYKDKDNNLYYNPSDYIIKRDELSVISKEEFDSISAHVEVNALQISFLAKKTRDSYISADITIESLDNAIFQCTAEAKDIKSVLAEAASISALDTDSILFRLADNSWKEINLLQLKGVLTAFTLRKKLIWSQFAEWDQGDKLLPFEVVYSSVAEEVLTVEETSTVIEGGV